MLLAMGLTPLVIELARRRRLVAEPNARTIHSSPVARLGGIAIFLATMLVVLPVLCLQNTIGAEFRDSGLKIFAILVGGSVMFALGIRDDIKHLRARTKIAVQLLVTIFACAMGVHINGITVRGLFSIDLGIYGCLITIFWVVGVTNAVNIIDGLDGLAAGISAIACGAIAITSIMSGNVVMAVLMLALLGSLVGFLFFNFSPAKIFMGDSGSLFIGFTIATASVVTAAKTQAFIGIALPILVLGIPIFDTFFSMLRRFLNRLGIMSPDRSHIHHRLLAMGLGQHQIAIAAYIITLMMAGMGFFLMATRSAGSVLIFICCLVILLLVFRMAGSVRLRETIAGIQRRKAIAERSHAERLAFEEARLHFVHASEFSQWWQAVCRAASNLGISELTMSLANRDGSIRDMNWTSGQRDGSCECVEMHVPIADRRKGSSLKMSVKIARDGSLEAAGRRIALLARLMEENGLHQMGKPSEPADVTTGGQTTTTAVRADLTRGLGAQP